MCGVSTEDEVRSDLLLNKLGLDDLVSLLPSPRLCWTGHVESSEEPIKYIHEVMVEGGRGRE